MKQTARMLRRRVLGLLLAVTTSLVLLEGVLQLGSWLMHLRAGQPEATGSDVLCVGDSFTYGLGARAAEDSYPATLAHLLRGQGHAVRVVNAGWPGRHSVEIAAELDQHLARSRPRVVCVLAGINDMWAAPGRVPAAVSSEATGFRWELRTLRLLRLLLGAARDPGPVAEAPTLQRSWQCGELVLDLRAQGRALVCGLEMTWRTEGAQFQLTGPAGPTFTAGWRLDGEELQITLPGAAAPLRFEPATRELLSGGNAKALAAALQRAQTSPHVAEAQARASLTTDPDDPAARLALLTALLQQGRRDQAGGEAERLAALSTRSGTRAAGEALVAGLRILRRRAAVIAAARDLVARHPDSFAGWYALGEESFHAGDCEQARTAAERCLELTPRDQTELRASLLGFRAAILRFKDPVASLRGLLEACLLGQGEQFTIDHLKLGHVAVTEAEFEAAVTAVTEDSAQRERLRALWGRACSREAQVLADLRCNLHTMVARARAAGAEVVLLGYPFPRPDLEAVQQDVADAAGVTFVSTWPAFAAELRQRARAELYILDGHCNGAGYALMARMVLPAVSRHLGPR